MSTEATESAVEHVVELALPLPEARHHLQATAEVWGGAMEGDNLVLPVLAGLQRGYVGGPVTLEEDDGSTRITFLEDESSYGVDRASFFVLVIAGLGALVTVLAPVFHNLWGLVPIGFLLAISGWLFIVARLRNSGPEEFFEELRVSAEDPGESREGVEE